MTEVRIEKCKWEGSPEGISDGHSYQRKKSACKAKVQNTTLPYLARVTTPAAPSSAQPSSTSIYQV